MKRLDRQVVVGLPSDLYDRLSAFSKDCGDNRSCVVRRILIMFFNSPDLQWHYAQKFFIPVRVIGADEEFIGADPVRCESLYYRI